jgi:hypothetical protein
MHPGRWPLDGHHGHLLAVGPFRPLWPGRPDALLRPAPLRTGRARFHASGSSKPVGVDRLVVVRRHAASLGPFTAEAASNLSSGSDSSSTSSWSSPDPRQHPFGSGHQAQYPASYPGPLAKGPAFRVPVPAAFRPPAFACRVILFPPGDWAFLTVGFRAPPGARTRTGLPRSALARWTARSLSGVCPARNHVRCSGGRSRG